MSLTSGLDHPFGQRGRNLDGRPAVALGDNRALRTLEFVELASDDLQVGACDGLVEPQQQVARRDLVAVAHADVADHATRWVLHLLDVGFDHDRALGNHGAGELSGRCPSAEPAGQEEERGHADRHVSAQAVGHPPAPGWIGVRGLVGGSLVRLRHFSRLPAGLR